MNRENYFTTNLTNYTAVSTAAAAVIFAAVMLLPLQKAQAVAVQGKGISFQAFIQNPAGEAINASNITVNAKILAPNGCVLREENFTNVTITDGYLNINITKGTQGGADPGLQITEIFKNTTALSSLTCLNDDNTTNGSLNSYTPSANDTRKLRITFANGADTILADFNMRSMPYAQVAESLNGKVETDFIQTSTNVTQTNLDTFMTAILQGACANGQVIKKVAGSWACANESGVGSESDPTVQNFAKNAPGAGLTVNGSNQLELSFGTIGGTAAQGNDSRITGAFQASTALGSDLSGTLPNPTVEKIKGQSITAAATTAGQVLRYAGGNNWTPGFVSMFDLRSTVTGSQTFGGGAAGCTAGQTLTWIAATDNLACANISITKSQVSDFPTLVASATTDTTNASNITSGTLAAGRLPVASGTADGIVNQIAQSFAGVKTFLDNAIFSGTITATGNISTSADLSSVNVIATGAGSFDRIKLAQSSATCDGTTEGSLRYNSTSKKMEFCNGTSWGPVVPADTTPDTYAFSALTNQAYSSDIISSAVTITGFDGPLTMSVSGDASARVCNFTTDAACGSWAASVSVNPGNQVKLKVTTGSVMNTTQTITASIGTGSANWSVTTIACPTNYILVPANAGLGVTSDFCVAMYEMKNDGSSNPISQASGNPWVSINANDASSECQSLNALNGVSNKYDLISNPEWMTIARNIENVATNWSGGSVGSGVVARGWAAHTSNGDSWSNTAVAPSTSASCLYNTAGDTCASSGTHLYRRTLTLSNGNTIWDFSGNVWEWVDWTAGGSFTLGPTDCSGSWQEFNAAESCAISTNDYKPNGAYTSTEGLGRWHGGAGGAAVRGGYWYNGANAGAFTLALDGSATGTASFIGFRCVFRP